MIGRATRTHARTPYLWCVALVTTVLVAACAEAAPSLPQASSGPPARTQPGTTTHAGPSPAMSPASTPDLGWHRVAPMPRERAGFDAVLMGDGTVLVVGDDDPSSDRAAPGSELVDVYDPATDTWRPAESLNKPRTRAATVVLPDGSAMVVGGTNGDGQPFSSTKVLATTTGSWGSGPLMKVARTSPEAVVLGSGHLLVVDQTDGHPATTSELLGPREKAWTTRRTLPGQVVAIDALVRAGNHGALAIGWERDSHVADSTQPAARYYDAMFDTWTTVPALGLQAQPALVTLADGSVLAIGGNGGGELVGHTNTVATVRRFDPAMAMWTDLAPMAEPRESAEVALLADGRVLVAGGMQRATDESGQPRLLASTEIYDPAANSWSDGPVLLEPRMGGTALTLRDGTVLVLGGQGSTGNLDTAERLHLDPAPAASTAPAVAPALLHWEPVGQLPWEDPGQLIGFDKGYVYVAYTTWFSPDGRTWEEVEPLRGSACPGKPIPTNGSANVAWSAATNGSEVILVGYQIEGCSDRYSPASWITSDGVTWEQSTSVEPTTGPYNTMLNVWAVPRGWEAAVSLDGVDRLARWTSLDGLTWQASPALPLGLETVAADGTRVGVRHRDIGQNDSLVVSTDGENWQDLDAPVRGGVTAVLPPVAASDPWIVVSESGTQLETGTQLTFATSTDLAHWASASSSITLIDGEMPITRTRIGVLMLSEEPCWSGGEGSGPAPSSGPPVCPEDEEDVVDVHVSSDGLHWMDVVVPGPLVAIADGPAGTLAVETNHDGDGTRIWRLVP